MNAEPKIIFLTGVSGAGKTTIMDLLLQDDRFQKVLSVTTRAVRAGEQPGDQYVFVSDDEFEQMQGDELFLECACVHGKHRYGTRLDRLQETLYTGRRPIKNIDPIGMEIIQREGKINGLYTCIFMDIDEEIMKERILSRQPDMSAEELQSRLQSAIHEKEIMQRLDATIIDASQTIDQVYSDVERAIFGQ